MDNGLVEVTDKCSKKKEHGVLCHEGFGQSVPPETIVHIIEDVFLSSAKVIELNKCEVSDEARDGSSNE